MTPCKRFPENSRRATTAHAEMLNEFRTIVGRMQQCGIGMERNEAEDEETAAGVTGEG